VLFALQLVLEDVFLDPLSIAEMAAVPPPLNPLPVTLPAPPNDPNFPLPVAPGFPPTQNDVLEAVRYRRDVDSSIGIYITRDVLC
jgi:hypothetical protein